MFVQCCLFLYIYIEAIYSIVVEYIIYRNFRGIQFSRKGFNFRGLPDNHENWIPRKFPAIR